MKNIVVFNNGWDFGSWYSNLLDTLTAGFFTGVDGAAGTNPSAPAGTQPDPIHQGEHPGPSPTTAVDEIGQLVEVPSEPNPIIPRDTTRPPRPQPPIPDDGGAPTPRLPTLADIPFTFIGLGPVSAADVFAGQPARRRAPAPRRPARRRRATPPARPRRRAPAPRPRPPSVPRPSSPSGVPTPRSIPSPVRVALPWEMLRRLWEEYLRPQPQGDPNARTRPGTSRRVPRRQPRGPVFPQLPRPRPETPSAPPQRQPGTATQPRTAAPEIWVPLPSQPDPFVRTPGTRAPGRANPVPQPRTPSEPAFPWPRTLLPFSPNPAAPPARRPADNPRPRPSSPAAPRPSSPSPLIPRATPSPLTPFNPRPAPLPGVNKQPQPSSDPCAARATEQRREQRRRRKRCTKFKYKRIKVCQSS